MKLIEHNITLNEKKVTLRPMTEDDWQLLHKWNSDPEVLYYTEWDDITCYTLEQVQHIYQMVSQHAYCFIIEFDNKPIGECWLQRMNLERILKKYIGLDCRRIDLMIGEKEYWRQGIGTEVVILLTQFAFDQEKADVVFGGDIADYNPASLRLFQKLGYEIGNMIPQPQDDKAQQVYDVVLTRERYFKEKNV